MWPGHDRQDHNHHLHQQLRSRLQCSAVVKRSYGTKSNRSGIGAKISVTTASPDAAKPFTQIDEVRSGGSYYSQNDLRIHFGLDHSAKADSVEIKWPSGTTDKLIGLAANHLYVIQEGGKILKVVPMGTSSQSKSPVSKL